MLNLPSYFIRCIISFTLPLCIIHASINRYPLPLIDYGKHMANPRMRAKTRSSEPFELLIRQIHKW